MSSRSPFIPRTPFIGVRISWLILARNSLFARLAAFARISANSSARPRALSLADAVLNVADVQRTSTVRTTMTEETNTAIPVIGSRRSSRWPMTQIVPIRIGIAITAGSNRRAEIPPSVRLVKIAMKALPGR